MSEFIVEIMPNAKENELDRFMVTQKSTGWFYPNLSEIEAETLCNKLNEPFEPTNSKTIDDYFKEWELSINDLTEKEVELITLKETYNELEFGILTTFNFKEKYGKDNEKIRKHHIKTELKEYSDKKEQLQLQIDFLKRRIDYIKNIMSMQRTLLECGVLE